MEWDSKAVDAFINMPLSGLAKSMAKVFAEKKARKNKSNQVTMKEIEATKKVYFESVPEDVRRKEWEKRVKEGETDLMQKVEKEAREILETEVDLFDVDLCHAQYFRCGSRVIEVRDIKKKIEKKGYRLMVGGGFGRHFKLGYEIFRNATEEELFNAIDACISIIREKAVGE